MPQELFYEVTIKRSNGEAFDSRDFKVGTWKEIGYWLDEYGYIDPAYHIDIKVRG
jgi:hypothetical protein